MKDRLDRRDFIMTAAIASTGLVLPASLIGKSSRKLKTLPKKVEKKPVKKTSAIQKDSLWKVHTDSRTDTNFNKLIAKITQGKIPKYEKVHLNVPVIAENGAIVPIRINVTSPMTEKDYVQQLDLIIRRDRSSTANHVYTVIFSPDNGSAYVNIRARAGLAHGSCRGDFQVYAYATMSNGGLFMNRKLVKVTIGCGE